MKRRFQGWRKPMVLALALCVLLAASGCAAHGTWTFGATRAVAGEDSHSVERPSVILLVPFVIFDIFVYPVELIHDQWPHSPAARSRNDY